MEHPQPIHGELRFCRRRSFPPKRFGRGILLAKEGFAGEDKKFSLYLAPHYKKLRQRRLAGCIAGNKGVPPTTKILILS